MSADVLFKAALKVARTHHVVTFVDENEHLITFRTGESDYSFNCTASIETEGMNESTLVMSMQNVTNGPSWGQDTRQAKKFFDYVQEELQRRK